MKEKNVTNNKIPKITLIVPIFNVEKWLDRCIKSILIQTFKNYEVLLIDDGSTDNSGQICDLYANKYDKIKVFHKQNGGLSDARNYGINRALGQYFVFIDSDDFIDRSYLEVLYNNIKKYKADVSMCSCWYCDENGNRDKKIDLKKDQIISGKELLNNVFNKDTGVVYTTVWTKMYKRELFSSLRFEKGKNFEDEYINPKLFFNVKSVVVINKPLYFYVIRKGSITQSQTNRKKIMDADGALVQRIHFYKVNNDQVLTKKAIYFYLDWIASNMLSNFCYLSKRSNKVIVRYLQNNYRKYFFTNIPKSPKKMLKGVFYSISLRKTAKISLMMHNNK